MRKILLVLLILGPVAALTVASAIAAAPEKITPAGVGEVKLGATYSSLRSMHLVGKLVHGCPLAGSNTHSASLSAPLKGTVDFTTSMPRKAADIVVRGGATARGVGIGATITQIKAKFPKAVVDHSTDHTFGVTIVRIPKSGGGKLEFAVDTTKHKTTLIGVPLIPFCE